MRDYVLYFEFSPACMMIISVQTIIYDGHQQMFYFSSAYMRQGYQKIVSLHEGIHHSSVMYTDRIGNEDEYTGYADE